ncbi:cellulase family glycosylhydrolase [Mycobacterium sp. BMJ-28]
MPEVKHVAAYQIENIAAIDESSTTVGIADSNIYFEGTIEDIKKRLDLIQSLGVTDVRLMVPWIYIQTQDPNGAPVDWNADLDWAKLDSIVTEVDKRGMGILGVLQWSPDWATDGATGVGHPTDVQDFADFAAAVARRYGDKISAYEVWNEPNASFFWNPADPVEYTKMLKATYTSLKAVSQDITVVGAVVGAGLTWGDLTMSPVDFVKAMYDAGADGYFDAISFHPYNFTTKFSEGNDVDWKELMPLFQVEQIRALMDQHIDPGEEQLKIWISEYGLPTSKVSASVQADFITDLINAWQTFSGAGPIFLYTTQDDLSAIGDDRYFGLFDANGNPKDAAALKQLKRLIDCLDGCTATNPLASLLEFVQQLVSNVLSFIPNLVATVVNTVANVVKQLLGAIGGALGGTSAVTTTALSAAKAGVSIDAVTAEEAADASAQSGDTGSALGEKAKATTELNNAEAASPETAAEPSVTETEATETTGTVVTEPVAATEEVSTEVVETPAATEESVPQTPVTEENVTTTDPAGTATATEPTEDATTDTTPQAGAETGAAAGVGIGTAKPETTKPETAKPEATKPEPTKDDTPKADPAKVDSAKGDTPKGDTPNGDSTEGASDDSTGAKTTHPGSKAGHPDRGTKPAAGTKPSAGDKPRHDGAGTPSATSSSQRENSTAKAGASASSGAGGSE